MSMTLVSTVTVGSATSSITFSSIPQTATDLVFVISAKTTVGVYYYPVLMTLNTGGTYAYRELLGNGGAVGSSNGTTARVISINGDAATANTFGNAQIYIPNYTSSSAKSASGDSVTESNSIDPNISIQAYRWSETAAITTVAFTILNGYDFAPNSTFSLYTITKGSGGATVS